MKRWTKRSKNRKNIVVLERRRKAEEEEGEAMPRPGKVVEGPLTLAPISFVPSPSFSVLKVYLLRQEPPVFFNSLITS